MTGLPNAFVYPLALTPHLSAALVVPGVLFPSGGRPVIIKWYIGVGHNAL